MMGEERHPFLGFLALADVANFEKALRRTAVEDRARRNFDLDRGAVPRVQLGIELDVLIREQPVKRATLVNEI